MNSSIAKEIGVTWILMKMENILMATRRDELEITLKSGRWDDSKLRCRNLFWCNFKENIMKYIALISTNTTLGPYSFSIKNQQLRKEMR